MMKPVLKHGGLAAAVICFTMTAQAQIGIFTQSQDIGDVGAAGSAKIENGEYIVEGSGADIKALCHDAQGSLLGYALTGTTVQEKLALNRQLPALLA